MRIFWYHNNKTISYKACFPGTYGPNCEQNCSAVCTSSLCHYVDGSCPCEDGQNGYIYCNESKRYPLWFNNYFIIPFWSM